MMRPSAALIPRVLGAILCLAAILKVIDLFLFPFERVESLVTLPGSSVELLVGTALLLRIQPAVSIPAGGLLFAMLAGVAMFGTVRGVSRYGCLGMVPMPPWVMLVFDLGAAIALFWDPWTSRPGRVKQAIALATASTGALFAGLAIGAVLYPRPGPTATATSAEAIATARSVTIEPGQLRGRTCFLLPYIRIDADLSRGAWKVILARAHCRKCERRLRSGGCEPDGQERVAVVLAERREGWKLPEDCKAILGHLSPEKTWLFDGPLTLRLIDGRVSEAR
jgi:hypothetical protein